MRRSELDRSAAICPKVPLSHFILGVPGGPKAGDPGGRAGEG